MKEFTEKQLYNYVLDNKRLTLHFQKVASMIQGF